MKFVKLAAVSAVFMAASAAHAAPVAIVNICAGTTGSTPYGQPATAGCTAPNQGSVSGPNGSATTPNPVVTSVLAAGGYSVSVVGIAGGGAFDAYTISNGNYSDSGWSFTANGVTQGNPGVSKPVFSTAAQALAAYQIGGSNALFYKFYLPTAQTVSFVLDDSAYPNFADDSGGVSLAINTAVPEPVTVSLFGMGLLAMGVSRRRRNARA